MNARRSGTSARKSPGLVSWEMGGAGMYFDRPRAVLGLGAGMLALILALVRASRPPAVVMARSGAGRRGLLPLGRLARLVME